MSHHSPSYAITIRLRYPDEAGRLGHITSIIGEALDEDALHPDYIIPKRFRSSRREGRRESRFRSRVANRSLATTAKARVSDRLIERNLAYFLQFKENLNYV